MLFLCDRNKKDPDGQQRTVKHRKTFGKGREMVLSVLVTLHYPQQSRTTGKIPGDRMRACS